jgi:hypothetical protein
MIEPVALQDFFVMFFSAAAVILFGAVYAGLFAWARLGNRRYLMPWAYGCYATLATAVYALAEAAHLHGNWTVVTVLMLLGYLLAPHGIWHLCAATHRAEHAETQEVSTHHDGDHSLSSTTTRKTP